MTDVLSDTLQRFVAEAPIARTPILDFVRGAATELSPGATLLDVGAGDAPYRELFSRVNYVTCDWERSNYTPDRTPDIVAPADKIPLEDESVDAILTTQVIEHVPEPWTVLAEFHRLLKPRGRLWMTAPLVWYLHEQPYDYYRYTSHGLRYLLDRARFVDIQILPLNDAFSSLSQLVSHLGWMMGRQPDGFNDQRDVVAQTMKQVASLIGSFSNFDTQWIFPTDYAVTATAP
ncbi:MAG: class I SAM-dependent methyltransferase [Candidatus Dormibacteria bacterium]